MHYEIPQWLFDDDKSIPMEIDEKFRDYPTRSFIEKSIEGVSNLPLPNIDRLFQKKDIERIKSPNKFRHIEACTGNKIDDFILLPRYQSSPRKIHPRRLDFDI